MATSAATAAGPYLRGGVSFALIGDTPYGASQEPMFDRVIDDINASRNVRLVVHSGDVKAGSERCDDALLIKRFDQYQKFSDPFILTPGDNDWTDCHRANNGAYLPTERLTRLRQIFYPVPGQSTGGKTMALRSQATMPGHQTFVENTMWSFAGVTMATVHVVGSNNNLDPWSGIDASDSYASAARRPQGRSAGPRSGGTGLDRCHLRRGDGTQERRRRDLDASQPELRTARQRPAAPGLQRRAGPVGRAQPGLRQASAADARRQPLFPRRQADVPAPSADRRLGAGEFHATENFGSRACTAEVFVDARDPEVFTVVPHIVKGNVYPR